MDNNQTDQVRYRVGQCRCGYRYLAVEKQPDTDRGVMRSLKKLAKSIRVNFHRESLIKCPRCKATYNPLISEQPRVVEVDTRDRKHLPEMRQQVISAIKNILE